MGLFCSLLITALIHFMLLFPFNGHTKYYSSVFVMRKIRNVSLRSNEMEKVVQSVKTSFVMPDLVV